MLLCCTKKKMFWFFWVGFFIIPIILGSLFYNVQQFLPHSILEFFYFLWYGIIIKRHSIINLYNHFIATSTKKSPKLSEGRKYWVMKARGRSWRNPNHSIYYMVQIWQFSNFTPDYKMLKTQFIRFCFYFIPVSHV